MTIMEQIATYLNNQGIATYEDTINSEIFLERLPDGNNIFAIYNSKGRKIESNLGYKAAGIQVIYRGVKNPITSKVTADSCYDILQGFSGYFVVGQNYIVSCLSLASGAENIGMTKHGEFEYSMNFIVEFKV